LAQKDALAGDLSIYFPGLASVLSFASLSVRPLFLSLFEGHILKLGGDALRPALKAVILALLPGLEDETSEDFERMVTAMDKLREAVEASPDEVSHVRGSSGSSHFWQCFFLATITNVSRRQGALAFLVRRLPKFGVSRSQDLDSLEASISTTGLAAEAQAAISPEPGLLIRCFESGLSDSQLLIQRGFLDLLVSHLPLDSPVLQQSISKEDLERLVAAAAGVVSRRDMSLNRRLWAWFLGPDPIASDGNDNVSSPVQEKTNGATDPSTQHAAFFSQYGLRALSSSVLKMIKRSSKTPAERVRPFRVCLSLMDRWEVGGLIVPEIFLPALESVQSYSESASREDADEVLRSASAFFDGVDSGLIWGKLIHLVTSSLDTTSTSHDEALRRMKLAKFVLVRFNLKEEDMLMHHLPLMILSTFASLNVALEDTDRSPVDLEIVEMALEVADTLIQMMPDRALRHDHSTDQQSSIVVTTSRESVFQQTRAFYEDSQGSLDAVDPPFEAIELGQFILREVGRLFAASLQSDMVIPSPDLCGKILANLMSKAQHLAVLREIEPIEIFLQLLTGSNEHGMQPSFCQLSAVTGVLTALQTSQPLKPYVSASQLPEIVHSLVASLWTFLSPTNPKYHVEATRCLLQLHTISLASQMVEAAISVIITEQLSHDLTDNDPLCAENFAILWSHTLYELSVQSEKRGNMTRRPSGMNALAPTLTPAEYSAMLGRPLLILLDTTVEEGSETSAFMRTWLQDVPSLGRVFEVLALRLQSLKCTTNSANSSPSQKSPKHHLLREHNDTKECLYYLGQLLHIIKTPSQLTWMTLAESPAPTSEDGLPHTTLQGWLAYTCLRTLDLSVGDIKVATPPHMHELHRVSVALLSLLYKSPLAAALRELELEVPLMARLRTAGPSLQSLLLPTILSALQLRLTRPPQERPADLKIPNLQSQRSRLSLVLSRDSEDAEPAPVPPPSELVDCLKYGFSSPTSRRVLDDWVHFLVEVLPMFADTIFQNLLPLVECFCKQINVCFEELKATFAKREKHSGTSRESTLISLINGLEQILAKAHDRLTIEETKVSVTKSPEQPQGFFSNVVSGVFTSDSNQMRTPTANSRLTVLLCFQDTVRICFAIWSWGGYGQQDQHDSTSSSSLAYSSLRMRNRARRILEHLFAAEALECLETLAVLWAQGINNDSQESAIVGLLNVLNGSKPKYTIPAIFNAVYSRTDPNALEANRMSTLTSDLSDAELVAFLVEYTKSLEDDAMDEIWQDCTLFLRDVLANPLPHRQILPTLLEFTAVIGQKVDNTNFGEQRKMRRELAVS
jgi:hypothetical protein